MANVGVGGLASFAANLANGYMRGKEHQREIARQEKQDEYQASQQGRENTLRTGLSNAAAPATMTPVEGSVLPQDQAGPSLQMYRVKGMGLDETTSDQAAASKSLAAYSAPEAVAMRQAGVYRTNAMPDKAMSLENAVVSRGRETEKYEADKRTTKHNEDTRAIDLANKAWRQKVGQAMFKPGETALSGLTELISESEFGPMKGKKVKDVLSADGKTVVMHVINADGSLTPTGLKFSNDQEGVTRAAYALDMAVTPEHRYDNFVAETKNAQQQKKDDKRDAETVRHNKAMEGLKGKRFGDGKSGGSGGSGGNIQKTFTDSDGYMVGVFRDGTSKRLTDQSGKPIKSDNIEKRVDALAKNLQAESREYRRMTYAEVRKAAQKILMGDGTDAEAPGPAPAPGLAGAGPANVPAMPKTKAELKTGTIYNTARGPAKWNGSAFEAQ